MFDLLRALGALVVLTSVKRWAVDSYAIRLNEGFRTGNAVAQDFEGTLDLIADGRVTEFGSFFQTRTSTLFPPVPSTLTKFVIDWRRNETEVVYYKQLVVSRDTALLDHPTFDIPTEGYVPSTNWTSFIVTLPCTGKQGGVAPFFLNMSYVLCRYAKPISEDLVRGLSAPLDSCVINGTAAAQNASDEDYLLLGEPETNMVVMNFMKECAQTEVETPVEDEGGEDPSIPIIIGCIVASLLVLMIITALLLAAKKRRRSLDEKDIGERFSALFAADYMAANLTVVGAPSALKVISSSVLKVCDKQLGGGLYGDVHMGTIWLHDKQDKPQARMVAVKMLKGERVVEAETEALLAEMRLMEKVGDHEHVVQTLFSGIFQGRPCIVMEYMPEGDLHSYVSAMKSSYVAAGGSQNVAVAPAMLFDIGLQVAKGMEFLSSKMVVHRDLAARNVLVRELKGNHLELKISDLGLARQMLNNEAYHLKTSRALPMKWMAIESMETGMFTSKSDVWSFGVLLWEVATFGEMPYTGTPNALLQAYLTSGNRLEQPTGCPDELYKLMMSCWLQDPAQRHTFGDLVTNLFAMLDAEANYIEVAAGAGEQQTRNNGRQGVSPAPSDLEPGTLIQRNTIPCNPQAIKHERYVDFLIGERTRTRNMSLPSKLDRPLSKS